jgi:O-antigen ligase
MLLNLSKVFLAMLILYMAYFQQMVFSIPRITMVLGFLTLFLLLILMYRKSTPIRHVFSFEIILWLVWAMFSLFTGYIIVANKIHLISSIFTYVQSIFFVIGIYLVCIYDKKLDFIINLSIILSLLTATTALFFGEVVGYGRLTLNAGANPNSVGLLLVIGLFCLLFKLNIKNKLSIALVTSGMFLFLYVIILTGSRKSFLAALFLIIFWLVFCFWHEIKEESFSRKTISILILVLFGASAIVYATPFLMESVTVQRLSALFESGDVTRTGMYIRAYELFKSSPLFGIGFNNFRLVSGYGTYSHSTYAEALASTGIIGSIIYFGSYLSMVIKIIKSADSKYKTIQIKARLMLGLFVVTLFLGAGVIHFYGISSFLIFAIIIAYYKLTILESSHLK